MRDQKAPCGNHQSVEFPGEKGYYVSLSASGEARSESKQILQRILYQLFLYFAIQLQDGQSNHLF